VLKYIRECRGKVITNTRWRDIYNDVVKPMGFKGRLLTETLPNLQSAGLIAKIEVNGYETFDITAEGLKAIAEYERLESDTELDTLPEVAKQLFVKHGYSILLPAQKEFLKRHFPPSRNIMILASPSAGKTFMAECCMLYEIQQGGSVLYVTPYKALNRQKYNLFTRIFKEFNVVRSDGDSFASLSELFKANLIASTYEKALLGVLRSEEWLQNLSLVVADEITLLGDSERGQNLDLLLSLLKKRSKILTLSSHIGNAGVLKEWLDADIYEYPPDEMSEEFIAKKEGLMIHIENLTGSQKTDQKAISGIQAVIQHSNLSNNNTLMVLVGTRQRAQEVASEIAKTLPRRKNRLYSYVKSQTDEETPLLKQLASVLGRGVSFHHAGLSSEARETVENLLDSRQLGIVISTPTLSHGVDFPIDHMVVDYDSFGGKRLKRIEYIQYRGRAARIGKSSGGNVYVLSEQDPYTTFDDLRGFLAKPVEDVFPPALSIELVEWIILLSCHDDKKKVRKTVLRDSESLLRSMLVCRNPKSNVHKKKLELILSQALANLAEMRLISTSRNGIMKTEAGMHVSKIDWTPRDAYRVLNVLKKIVDEKSEETIARWLLFVTANIGLVKRFDRNRTLLIIKRFMDRLQSNMEKELAEVRNLRGMAVASLLMDWINEAPIGKLLEEPAFGNIVHDEDLRKLGNYAGIEMGKIGLLSEELGYRKIMEIAQNLAIRLKRGAKEDLVNEDPAIDLFKLEGIGRNRARLLFKRGFENLLDIYELIFHQGEQAFIEKSGLPQDLSKRILEQLRTLVKSDERLLTLCKDL